MARILIADDRPVNRELLVTLLQHAGHETVEASDGVEAFAATLHSVPDVMIVDVAMHRMDGLTLARAVRSFPELADIPIIFYTAGESAREAQAWAASMDWTYMLAKPAEPEVILQRVADALGMSTRHEMPSAIGPLDFRLSALVEAGIEVAGCSSARQLVEVFTTRSADIVDAELSAAFIQQPELSRFIVTRDMPARWEALPHGRGSFDILTREGQRPQLIDASDRRLTLLESPVPLSSAIIATIETKLSPHGLLWFGKRRGEFSSRDLRFASTLASQFALAYDNIFMHESQASDLEAAGAELTQRTRDLEALSARLVATQEEVRTRVSREIHDELGQLLTATKMEISSMTPSDLKQRMPRALQLIDDTIDSVRRIAADLRPATLDQFGLVVAVENEVALFQLRTGIESELSIRPASIVLDRDTSTTIFRVIQEALTNVARHAQATRMEVRLRQSPGEIVLEIRDDGIGIDPDAIHASTSLGLIGIRERVRLARGTVAIEGVRGRGTIFTVRLPTQEAA